MPTLDAESGSRRIAGSVVLAIAAGGLALALHREAPQLAAPATCAGLLEAVAVGVARLAPSTPLGTWLLRLWIPALVASVALVALLARRLGARGPIAAATAITCGTLPLFARNLAPLEPLGVAVVAATLLAALGGREPTAQASRWTLAGLVLTALIVPALALPLAVVAAWHAAAAPVSARRRLRIAIAALLPVLAASALAMLMPPLPPAIGTVPPAACVLPLAGHMPSPASLVALVQPFFAAGPYAVVLAALGAFGLRGKLREPRHWAAIAYATTPLVAGTVTQVSDGDLWRLLSPALAAFWGLVAVGLVTVVDTCRHGLGGRLAAALLVGLLPGLQIMRPPAFVPADRVPFGHQRLSGRVLQTHLNAFPNGTTVVIEDAVTDLLLRSGHRAWARTGKSFRIVDRRSPLLADLASEAGNTVLALPAAQLELQYLGFRLEDLSQPQWVGVARVLTGGPCRPVTRQWADVSAVAASGHVALVADDDEAVGPVTMYFGGDKAFGPKTLYWPGATTRGFFWSVYGSSPNQQERLKEQMASERAADNGVSRAAFAMHLEIWRTPDAPPTLGVDLGAVPAAAIARLRLGSPAQNIRLCAAFPHVRHEMD